MNNKLSAEFRRRLATGVLLCGLSFWMAISARADRTEQIGGRNAVPGQVLVQFLPGLQAQGRAQIAAIADADTVRGIGGAGTILIHSKVKSTAALIRELSARNDIAYVEPDYIIDVNNHGTHCSGTIGAVGNNGVGVAGVNWTASIMACKFLDASGSGSLSNAINAIEFAIQVKAHFGGGANVRVLSNSWAGGGFSQ